MRIAGWLAGKRLDFFDMFAIIARCQNHLFMQANSCGFWPNHNCDVKPMDKAVGGSNLG